MTLVQEINMKKLIFVLLTISLFPGGKFYAIWAAENVKDEVHKGGWRLAALLE